MKPKCRTAFIFLFFLLPVVIPEFSGRAVAQKLDHVLGEILVQFQQDANIDEFEKHFSTFQGERSELNAKRVLVLSMNIWQFQFNHNAIHENLFLEKIKIHPSVANAQFNHFVNLRSTIPNDPQFGQQWQYLNDGTNGTTPNADIDADLAWDIATGGLSPNGDTIVVCVIDSGIDHDHEDLVGNIWVNYGEIPNNGIDDDGNGFIDDRRGWNAFSGTDNTYTNDDHGTPVNGIIGAKGNNNIGVTGINWNIKIMNVVGGSGQEAEALISYSYPLANRIKYNQTNGAEGAFVVATNASWGNDMGQASNFPLWCAMYDTLGRQGILNCGAAINSNVDVDMEGDMPTTCTSDFLLGITNTNSADEKSSSAGFGATSVDLGAPGDGSWTIDNSNKYNTFSGTSAATPHVVGAIALLYAAPCTNIANLALNDPPAAALKMREYILDGVDLLPALNGITVTGGRLNVFNSITLLMDDCGPCPTPSSLKAENITTTSADVIWIAPNSTNMVNLRYREIGAANWIDEINVNNPFTISNLLDCRNYEVQVEALCTAENSGFSNSSFFTSDGCCLPPNDISINEISDTSAFISWTPITAAAEYNITLTSSDPSVPTLNISSSNANWQFTALRSCTPYEVSVQTVCVGSVTEFSSPISFSTIDCGTCQDANYCTPGSDDASSEWIEKVEFNTINNTSGLNLGYADFTATLSTDVNAGESYMMTITPGYSFNHLLEYFRVWIDWNQDGDLDDPDELVVNTAPTNMIVNEEISIPMGAVSGNTRMRVMMRWAGMAMSEQPPCSTLDYGEFEDYCVNIIGGTGVPCIAPKELDTINTSLNGAILSWEEPMSFETFNFQYRKMGTAIWADILTPFSTLNILGLEKCNTYEARVQTICDSITMSNFTPIFTFNTQCDVGIEDYLPAITNLTIAPNPFTNNIRLTFSIFENKEITFQVFSATGQLFFKKTNDLQNGAQHISFDELGFLPSGIYFLQIKTKEGSVVKKVVKQ